MSFSVRLRSAGSLLALAISAAPLVAQTPKAGTVEANVGVRVSDVGIRNGGSVTSPTGLLGLFLHKNFSVETELSSANSRLRNPSSLTSYTPWHLRGVYHIPVGEQVSLLLGAGGVRNEYRTPTTTRDGGPTLNNNEFSWATMVGTRLGLTDNVAFRAAVTLDGAQDHADNPRLTTKRSTNLGGQFGVSYLFGVKPPDADGDCVPDGKDRCASTPTGVAVDANGCPIDSDRDGVADYQDKCANTPAGVTVDSTGCPVDSDRDGVADYQDKCPNTPSGARVDATGCPVDSDNDGVPDFRDRCPNTPAGDRIDANGCSLPKDDDGDGVMNDADRCAGTPAGTRVDAAGCPQVFEGERLVLQGVTFATGTARLTRSSSTVLDEMAGKLKANTNVRIEIGGHTDNRGNARTNTRLSLARANAVKAYLVRQGVDAGRMDTKGYGPSEPAADNRTAAGRQQNRRVELKIVQ
jgi:outer membrane protein OmpA-like peptidoglycan-associated protein/opacity protein-like surface antigen